MDQSSPPSAATEDPPTSIPNPRPARSLLYNNFCDESTREISEASGSFVRNVRAQDYVSQRSISQDPETAQSLSVDTTHVTSILISAVEAWPDNHEGLPSLSQDRHEEDRVVRAEYGMIEKEIYHYQFLITRWNRFVDRQLMTASIVIFSSALIALQNFVSVSRVQMIASLQNTRTTLQQLYGGQLDIPPINSVPYEASAFLTLASLTWGALASSICLWVKRELCLSACFPDRQEDSDIHVARLRHHFSRLEKLYIPQIIKYLPVFPSISVILLLSGVAVTCVTFSPALAILGALVVCVYAANSFGMIMELRKEDQIPITSA